MIITRTGEKVEFQLTAKSRVAIDASRVASAFQVVERADVGKLVNALVLIMDRGEAPIRVEASAAQVAAMHARVTDILSETTGSNETLSSRREHLGH